MIYSAKSHHPGQVVGYKNSKKFKRLDLFQDTAARSNGRALETIIMEKVKRHDLTFWGVKAHIVINCIRLDLWYNVW